MNIQQVAVEEIVDKVPWARFIGRELPKVSADDVDLITDDGPDLSELPEGIPEELSSLLGELVGDGIALGLRFHDTANKRYWKHHSDPIPLSRVSEETLKQHLLSAFYAPLN